MAKLKMNMFFEQLYQQNYFLRDSGILHDKDIAYFDRASVNMNDADATLALHRLSEFLSRYYNKNKPIFGSRYHDWNNSIRQQRSCF